LDVDYAQRKTLWLDLLIIIKTPLVILSQLRELLVRKLRAFRSRSSQAKLGCPVDPVISPPANPSRSAGNPIFSNKPRKNYE
jgi:hypothetical protein